VMSILIEVGAGLGVILGCRARISSLVLFLFLIPVSLVYHNFWAYTGAAAENQMQHFMKNMTIMGGLLTLAAAGAGRFALDALGPWMGHVEHRPEETRREALTR